MSVTPLTESRSGAASPLTRDGGLRVLMIDDEISLMLAEKLFAHQGIDLVPASSLTSALDAADGSGFHCLFLDPTLSGSDGCRLVRDLQSDARLAGVPIVAMLPEGEEKALEQCHRSGIRAFVRKPLEPTQVQAVLMGLEHAIEDDGWTVWGEGTSSIHFPKTDEMDIGSALTRLNGNTQLLGRLLRRFFEEHIDDARRIREAWERGDASETQRLAHSLKGSSAYLCATALSDSARDVEHSIKLGTPERVPNLLPPLEKALERVARVLEVWQGKDGGTEAASKGAAAPVKFDRATGLNLLSALAEPLERRRPVECRKLLDQLGTTAWPTELSEGLRQLQQAVRGYRFKEGQAALSDLLGKLLREGS